MQIVFDIATLACVGFLIFEIYQNRKLKNRIKELEGQLNEK